MKSQSIIESLPYSEPFLFVDEILSVSENEIKGIYTFRKDEYFYKGHFRNKPVTPGVILIECMAQIGLVCLWLGNLSGWDTSENGKIALSEAEVVFERPVEPGETVKVHSRKIYQRLGKLKCEVKMYNNRQEVICRGKISGLIKNPANGA